MREASGALSSSSSLVKVGAGEAKRSSLIGEPSVWRETAQGQVRRGLRPNRCRRAGQSNGEGLAVLVQIESGEAQLSLKREHAEFPPSGLKARYSLAQPAGLEPRCHAPFWHPRSKGARYRLVCIKSHTELAPVARSPSGIEAFQAALKMHYDASCKTQPVGLG